MGLRSIGVDVGGTRTKLVLLDHPGEVCDSREVSSRVETPEALVDAVADATRAWLHSSPRPVGLGVAVPGLVDRSTGCVVQAPNLPILNDFDIRGALQRATGLTAELDNDANVAGLAEARLGAAADCHSAVCLTVGTGLGGAIICEGRLWRGFSGMAGEVGRLLLDDDPTRFLEEDVGAPAVVRAYEELATGRGEGPIEGVDAAEVARRAASGDTAAREALARCGRRLGVVLAILVNVLNPERIVVGGGVAGAGEWFLGAACAEGERRAWAQAWRRCEVVAARLGTRAGAIGAALLVEHADD
jgi:glucokinase